MRLFESLGTIKLMTHHLIMGDLKVIAAGGVVEVEGGVVDHIVVDPD